MYLIIVDDKRKQHRVTSEDGSDDLETLIGVTNDGELGRLVRDKFITLKHGEPGGRKKRGAK